MNWLVLSALLVCPARAEHSAVGGGASVVSIATGESIYSASAVPGGINGQLVIRRLSADGGVYWEQRYGRGRGEDPTAIATVPGGGVVVAGVQERGCFVARFDAQGRLVWETFPASGLCRPAGLAADAEGAAYLLATVDGRSGFDTMVWKLNPRGDTGWSHRHASNESLYAQNLYLDPRGDRLRAFVLRKRGVEFLEEFFRLDLSGRVL